MRWWWFFCCFISSLAMAQDDSVFVAATSAHQTQVALFKFDSPELQQKAITLAKSLRCPQCQNQNLVESNSPIALDLRLVVFEMINQGKSEQQVIDYMTARFGDFVLYNPPLTVRNSLLWGLPLLVLLAFVFGSASRVVKGRHKK
ncbi:heme lyase NrfEFG subunit NrfF [Vibrio panuliri]|uniref:Formate-dependent nitrite reductase complex subunit n=1 Tax=Vibrio panuliri TaxID=1381081 RepID=A0ABX3FKP3_9VIBR|nr:heme lyase NrfEFG subunit NrfF [Vibrio panuliri]KAB1455026.1 heme lyase NrfEFG subunit NrfF [Vibrio panuliri]OLQ94751.1 cytochrome c biogenesis protein CcmH [Vibrio panuliri]